ncbi:MAG: CinA family protein [Thermoguttaceae bacterium]|jgi:nicotinamide mononucleotide (NMN) deamidase PncC
MSTSLDSFVQLIHDAPGQVVLAMSGGGSRAIAELLEVPGASRTLLEAVVPYSEASLISWLGGRPDQFCGAPTARAMAVVALGRARQYGAPDDLAAGIAATAGLSTDRPKRGAHRAHVALQTASRTATWSVEFRKDLRSRVEEERVVSRMLLNATARACGIPVQLDLPLAGEEEVEHDETIAPPAWRDLLLGKAEMVLASGGEGAAGSPAGAPAAPVPRAILPGAFNPPHAGHLRIADVGREILGLPVAVEMSIRNVDKPPLDYYEIQRRFRLLPAELPVCLSRAATFEEKSRLFPGATFLVGVDTLRRIASPQYYSNDAAACLRALEAIAQRGCRFLVFGRDMGTGFVRLGDLDVPGVLRRISREVPPELFREDVSSAAIRKSGEW